MVLFLISVGCVNEVRRVSRRPWRRAGRVWKRPTSLTFTGNTPLTYKEVKVSSPANLWQSFWVKRLSSDLSQPSLAGNAGGGQLAWWELGECDPTTLWNLEEPESRIISFVFVFVFLNLYFLTDYLLDILHVCRLTNSARSWRVQSRPIWRLSN